MRMTVLLQNIFSISGIIIETFSLNLKYCEAHRIDLCSLDDITH
jgi:hypothetical protein